MSHAGPVDTGRFGFVRWEPDLHDLQGGGDRSGSVRSVAVTEM
ncbi:hypothetical protein RSSM_00717 [Rhodopirellula sallentina SM41]|uniref:Uncharacterized protein n=1 Tax=Rhodopirellula sallentina SM41 TaxID=1263870 RepID=M5U995_9BACT|nr:hypothetical protein RSSM_00717 [Rhodopirellula sallentina SM41]